MDDHDEDGSEVKQSILSQKYRHNRMRLMDDEALNSGSDHNEGEEERDIVQYADIEVDASNHSKKQKIQSSSEPKTNGLKRKNKDYCDDNNNDDKETKNVDLEYYGTMGDLTCEFINEPEVTEVSLSETEKVLVPKEYVQTVADINDPSLMLLSIEWIRDNIETAPAAKIKKKSKDEKQQCENMLKEATEQDIANHLKLDSRRSTAEELTDILKIRLMRTHFKFAFFLHVGQLLDSSLEITRYFSTNAAKEKFKCRKGGLDVQVLIISTNN